MAATVSETSHASIYQKMLIRLTGLHTGRNHPQAQGSEDSSVLLLTLIKQIKEFQLQKTRFWPKTNKFWQTLSSQSIFYIRNAVDNKFLTKMDRYGHWKENRRLLQLFCFYLQISKKNDNKLQGNERIRTPDQQNENQAQPQP